MPAWMKELHSKISVRETHINVRLFIAKLVVNIPKAFRPYATQWWQQLAILIGEGYSFGTGINYFIQDLCTILLSWSFEDEVGGYAIIKPKSQDRDIVYSMLKYLMLNTPNNSPNFMSNSVKIVQIFLERWKESSVIPTDVIYSHLRNSETVTAGIYLFSAVLVNNLDPFNYVSLGDLRITEKNFYTALVDNLTSHEKKIYSPCSVVTGQALSYLAKIRSTVDLESVVNQH
ncbi:hypothetical protein HK096_000756, partial [Nowakowskiella sp. JEL0078]